ncbi:MAG: hypothetical protein ACLFNR_01170 [Candidatus Paceibacterota bacterium]
MASYSKDHKLKNGSHAGLEDDERAQEMLEDEIFEGVRTRLRSGDPADGTADHFCVETRIEPLKPWAWDREYLCIDREGEVYENSSYRCGSIILNSEEKVKFSCER